MSILNLNQVCSHFGCSIVAVHGLGGDSYATWTTEKTLWLRDLLPKSRKFNNARIMTFGYDARAFIRPFQASSTGRSFIFAEALVDELLDKRTGVCLPLCGVLMAWRLIANRSLGRSTADHICGTFSRWHCHQKGIYAYVEPLV